jgi:hypothetical protein
MTQWATGVVDRAVRTGLQTLLAYLSAAQLILSSAALATLYSVVSSVATTKIGSADAIGQVDLSAPPAVRGA